MQLDPIGATAVRTLGIDIANLTSQLALANSIIDQVVTMVGGFDLSKWDHAPIVEHNDETDMDMETGFIVTLPGSEAEKVQALLSLVQSLN